MENRPTLKPMIQGIVPGLPEIGKIKIGRKGRVTQSAAGKTFQLPERIDHFIVTTLERGEDGNFVKNEMVHQGIGDKPTVIPVSLLYNDPELNFQSRRACFTGTQLWCAGDGVHAYRKQKDGTQVARDCPCERAAPDFNADQYRCKITGVLSVVLGEMMTVGGVFKFRTTSYNSVVNIMSSLALIQRITGGVLAGIPLVLTLRPKTVIIPGSQKTMKVFVVGIEYQGSMRQLADVGYQIALGQAKHQQRIEMIETQARDMITGTNAEADIMLQDEETEQEIAEEFYPESIDAKVEPVQYEAPEEKMHGVMRNEKAYNTPPPVDPFYSLFPDSDRDELDLYVMACADHFKCDPSEIKTNAQENPDAFVKAFHNWIGKQKRAPKPTVPEPQDDSDQPFIDEWWKKRSGGYATYVFKNRAKFAECNPETLEKAIGKWKNIYTEDWPLNGAPDVETSEGDSMPVDKIVQPATTESFDDLINTDEWQEMNALKQKDPEMFFRVSGGQMPKTMDEIVRIIDQMSLAGDEMPGA